MCRLPANRAERHQPAVALALARASAGSYRDRMSSPRTSSQSVDVGVLGDLDPSDRTLLADYCFLESASKTHSPDDELLLEAVGLQCELLTAPATSRAFMDIDTLRKRQAALSEEAHRALWARTELWIATGEPGHLVGLLEQLKA